MITPDIVGIQNSAYCIEQQKNSHVDCFFVGARERSRTSMPLRALPPQGSASTISPPAHIMNHETYNNVLLHIF